MSEAERKQVAEILQANAKKNFVDRVINRDQYPSLDAGSGYRATHKMAWGEVDGKYVVYPTIVYEGGKLQQLDDDAALDYALKKGEFIEMPSASKADWLSRRYKAIWGSAGD